MWDHCNKALHNSQTHCDDIIESKINDQVWELFAYGLQAVLCSALPFFHGTVEELLQHPNSYKEQWVASIQAAIRRKQQHKYGMYYPSKGL